MIHLQGTVQRVREAETDAGRSRVELTTTYVQGCQACRAKQTAFEVQVTPAASPSPQQLLDRPALACCQLLASSVCTKASFKIQAGLLPLPACFLCLKARLLRRWGVQLQSASTGQAARPMPL